MASLESSNEIEFVNRGADLRSHTGLVDLVHPVYLVSSVYLVDAFSLVQPNRRDRPHRLNNRLLIPADWFSNLLLELQGKRYCAGSMDRQGASRSPCFYPRGLFL